ncbi:MAG: DUF1192 domain-containing protein [Reyranella sp.]|uniref:DUF1192 domain-containing protein n=1 Tax=Reyranella sp. TaxID=1929291 RepID=UPI00122AB515|nr:DUF1192 domain-containing protein [Reyranella sp.]TAJ37668.1 MAG: DUF1192 domain-containing protein [Reyranella sp.]
MAFETDDLEPLKKKSQPRNLDPMSVDELREYITVLKAEIARVEEKIKAKQSHASAAASFFKK